MASIHVALTVAVAGSFALALAIGLVAFVRDRSPQPWLDRIILLVIASAALAALSGLGLVLAADRPRDVLHLLYGVVVVALMPVTRYMGRSGRCRSRAAWITLGGGAGLLVVVLLAQTG